MVFLTWNGLNSWENILWSLWEMNEILSFSMPPCLQCLRSVRTVKNHTNSKLSSVGHEQDVFFACITAMLFSPSFLIQYTTLTAISWIWGYFKWTFHNLRRADKPTGLCTDALLFGLFSHHQLSTGWLSWNQYDCLDNNSVDTAKQLGSSCQCQVGVCQSERYRKMVALYVYTMLVYFVSAH